MAIATFVDADRSTWDARAEELVAGGVPPALAARVASPGALFAALDVIEVADATSQPVKDVAALHFRLGSRLHLHWLRDRIADLSREDRWQEMARAALDDLFSLHGELTADVLHGSPAASDVDAASTYSRTATPRRWTAARTSWPTSGPQAPMTSPRSPSHSASCAI